MDFTQICRTCLSTELLSPIFKDNIDANSFSAALSITTGLKIAQNDGLPQNMCDTCTSFLQDVENFKRQCQAAEIKLLSMKETFVKEEINSEYQVHTKVKKQKKHGSKNCNTKNLKKMLGTASKKVRKKQINTRQSDSCKIQSKITDMEAVNTDIQKLDEEDSICNDRNINKCDMNCDGNNFSTKHEINYNNDKTFTNDESFQTDIKLVSVKNEDFAEKSEFELHESEYETEFLDLGFDSDTKEWFFKEDVKNSEIFKSYKKLKTKTDTSITKTDEKLVDWDTKTVESDTKPVLTDTKIIDHETNTTIEYRTKTDDEKEVRTETNMSEINAKEQKLQKNLIYSSNEIDMKYSIEFDVKNEKTYNSENQLFEVNGSRAICKLCQKEMSKRSIVGHITVCHPGADERRAKCDFCDSYILKTQMRRHTTKMHGEKCSICMYCHKEHSSSEELIDHVPICGQKRRRRKTNIKDRECLVECEICHKSMLKASLKMHQDVRHRGIKPVCEHCGRRMGNKLRLQEHLRARHGHAKLECAACEFRTASRTALTNHMRRHRGERPFVCEQCGAKFHAAYLLTQHKHAHRTRKDVKCEQCPAAFKTNNHLLMHKKSCHNNNIYQCEHCGREFKCPQYLSKHVRALHPHTRTPATYNSNGVARVQVSAVPQQARARPAPTHSHTGDIQQ